MDEARLVGRAAGLRRVALLGLKGKEPPTGGSPAERAAWASAMVDGAGQRRPAERWMLARLGGIPLPIANTASSPDVRAWAAIQTPELWSDPDEAGPYAPELRSESIETWTECELCILHARAWADRAAGGLGHRVIGAAEWLVRELQPDNATTRPWGIQAFAWLAEERGDAEADHYAQTLVHNTLVAGAGTPEPMSACILLDAAECLESLAGYR
ncbi:MAG: hypothetical protein ACOYN0_04935 [Phycisphaerales bacterium]